MAVGASGIVVQIAAGVNEFLATGRERVHFLADPLREDGVAGVAVIGLDGQLLVFGLVPAVVTTETAGPDHMAEVVRINAPVGLHFGEEIIAVNLLHRRDDVADAGIIWIRDRKS